MQEVVELRHDFFLEVVISQIGFKSFPVYRRTLMKAEGMLVIRHSTQIIDLRECCNFPSQSRVRPSHDNQDAPSCLCANRVRSSLEGARKLID